MLTVLSMHSNIICILLLYSRVLLVLANSSTTYAYYYYLFYLRFVSTHNMHILLYRIIHTVVLLARVCIAIRLDAY